ncbi:MAG TPA: archaetidylserine decarboxylase [Pseudobdellovibrionaceae bacterium]|mgnify:CR=1 FL=1|jgi:phosphatidylserine decarboxylase|nr:archaetidylserine decarboxylase [Pseudobdellovibrionaceae bacterium]
MHGLIIKAFIWIFKVQSYEAEKDISEYPNLREFFIRKLKRGLRPLASAEIIHPCDSRIQEHGEVIGGTTQLKEATLLQAKGVSYSLNDFSQDSEAAKKWNQGYFVTYYLHPRDYHWAHFPMDGVVTRIKKIPGHLWPVNQWAVSWIPNLYIQNARVFIELSTAYGPVGICMVGAFNVGRISIEVQEGQTVKKGDPLGYFNFGSTVIVLYPSTLYNKYKNQFSFPDPIRLGETLVTPSSQV